MRLYRPKFGILQAPGYRPDGSYAPNEYYMDMAIAYAQRRAKPGQHPVGALVTRTMMLGDVNTGQQRGHEAVAGIGASKVGKDSFLHAEAIALEKAESRHGRQQLENLQAVLYTTHEPCSTCAGYVADAKISGVVYGTTNDDALQLAREEGISWRSNEVSGLDGIRSRLEAGASEQFIIGGFMREQCLDLLRSVGQLSIG